MPEDGTQRRAFCYKAVCNADSAVSRGGAKVSNEAEQRQKRINARNLG
jgi:hypothetical protein